MVKIKKENKTNMEKYYYKYIQRLNGKHEKRKPVGILNTKMEIILKKEPNRSYRMKITVFKLKTLHRLRVLGRAKEKIGETKDRAIETIWMETQSQKEQKYKMNRSWFSYGMSGALTYM